MIYLLLCGFCGARLVGFCGRNLRNGLLADFTDQTCHLIESLLAQTSQYGIDFVDV